jgi:hypothetical protein
VGLGKAVDGVRIYPSAIGIWLPRGKVLRPCPGCGVEFGARDLRKHTPRLQRKETKAKAINQSLRPSDFAPAFGRTEAPSGALFFGTAEAVPLSKPRALPWAGIGGTFGAVCRGSGALEKTKLAGRRIYLPSFFAKDAKDWASNICGQLRLQGVNHPPIVTHEEKPRAKALFVSLHFRGQKAPAPALFARMKLRP